MGGEKRLQTTSDSMLGAVENQKENYKPFRRQRETTEVFSQENYMEEVESERPSVSGKKRVLRIPGVKNKFNIGSWNVQSLFEAGKLANTIKEMRRLNLALLGICETRWPSSGRCITDDAVFYHSGNEDQYHRYGVGIIVDKHLSKGVTDFIPYNDRTMLLKIEAKPINISIIQVYATTLDKSEEEIESFYEDIKQLLKYTKPHDLNSIQGDFNAKVGKGEVIGGVVGPWGLGERNIRGDRLIQFCQEEHFKIMNTWFSLPPRRYRFSTTVSRAQTYPGADVPSDHCLLTISIKLKLALCKVNKGQIRKLDTSKLQQEEIKSDLRNKLNQKLEHIKDQTDQQPLEVWETVETTIKNVTIECLGYEKRRSKKKWMTDEILQLMDKRRQHKNTNHDEYKRLNSLIRSDIRKAKRKWLEGECKEIEYLQQIHNTREEHKKMKEASGMYKKRPPGIYTDDTNKFIIEANEKKQLWEEYVTDLLADDSREGLKDNQLSESLSGPPILREEIKKVVMEAKDHKATGPDVYQGRF
ncbi:craniofacial development protein 2-like [Cylas formicarius]|uniref:craniofacial development protein 2-like n=1 Tax=Cylas formicarius TaxID=197179 RepID=UPI0029586F66|nr:craniofacial development protein 2-like [Cylas formicarius]